MSVGRAGRGPLGEPETGGARVRVAQLPAAVAPRSTAGPRQLPALLSRGRVGSAYGAVRDRCRRRALRLSPRAGLWLSLALVSLLLTLAGLTAWVSTVTRQAADQASRATLLSDDFQAARFAIAEEDALHVQYGLQPSVALLEAHSEAGCALRDALRKAAGAGNAGDRRLVAQVTREQTAYVVAVSRMFDAFNIGDRALAERIHSTQVDPIIRAMEQQVNAAAAAHEALAHTQISELDRLQDGALTAAPYVLGVGLLLVMLLWLVQHAAHRAREANSYFLSRMSHELRTPLNAVLGFCELMQTPGADSLTDRQRRHLSNIETGGRQLLSLINELRDLSKVEAGRMEFSIEDFELAPLVSATLTQMSPLADRRNVALSIETAGLDLKVRGDRRRLQQVLLNGLSNAVKYTPPGGRVRVRTRGAVGKVAIEVVDEGPGMRADQLATAMMDFGQVTRPGARLVEGTGLGLPLARKLAEAMGGALHLESEVGAGTTFRVVMPGVAPLTVVRGGLGGRESA